MNNINKNYLIIGGIAITICIVILIYIINRGQTNYDNYEELEIISNQQENAQEETEKIKIHIAGSVVTEGIIELEEGARVADAIKEAGGTTVDADMSQVNLAYKLQDGQKIYIPNQNDEQYEITEGIEGMQSSEETSTNTEIININTAKQTELELLPGIGPSTAIKIIEYREENGKFQTIEEIKNVPGIGEAKYENIKNQITV